jgi:hypothetical protein
LVEIYKCQNLKKSLNSFPWIFSSPFLFQHSMALNNFFESFDLIKTAIRSQQLSRLLNLAYLSFRMVNSKIISSVNCENLQLPWCLIEFGNRKTSWNWVLKLFRAVNFYQKAALGACLLPCSLLNPNSVMWRQGRCNLLTKGFFEPRLSNLNFQS